MRRFLREAQNALLIILGDGVVANVLLNRSKAQNGGWIVITAGWALAVFVAVFAVGRISGRRSGGGVQPGLRFRRLEIEPDAQQSRSALQAVNCMPPIDSKFAEDYSNLKRTLSA